MAVAAVAGITTFALSATPVFSADNGAVTATVMAATPCLTIGGAATIDFGTGQFSTATAPTVLSKLVGTSSVTNCGSRSEQIFARGTDAMGGTTTPQTTWSLRAGAQPCSHGLDVFGASTRTNTASPINLTTTNANLNGLAAGATEQLGFDMFMPCTGSAGSGLSMRFSYIYTATF